MLAEVGLITIQQWRGVPSHFNRSTDFDATILLWIEGLILFATLVIADLTWGSFLSISESPDMKLGRSDVCFGFKCVSAAERQITH